MSFISLEFLVFFLLVALFYGRLGHRWQNRLLLVASYVFYGWWDWRFLGLLLLTSVVDYLVGRGLDREPRLTPRARRGLLVVSLAFNLGLLGVFKYLGFFVASARALLADLLPFPWDSASLELILPVGISFYTFQSMSYTIDIYRGELRATRRLEDFLLFVAFFPQLVAGPIERATRLLPQLLAPRTPDPARIASGIQLALLGFAKKMVVADNLAPLVDSLFRQPTPDAATLLVAGYAFAFQIYADFSGYSDIAIGTARILGFELSRNFRAPYLATDPSDFWRRWHISLSSWLRDYLYIPCGGNRGGRLRTWRNLWITMLLGGLWHGAAWNFVLWGGYHALLLTLFNLAGLRSSPQPTTSKPSGWRRLWRAAAFFQLTTLGWLLFRSRDDGQLAAIGHGLLHGSWSPATLDPALLLQLGLFGLPLLALDWLCERQQDPEPWTRAPVAVQAACCVGLFYLIVGLGTPHATSFIYFQF